MLLGIVDLLIVVFVEVYVAICLVHGVYALVVGRIRWSKQVVLEGVRARLAGLLAAWLAVFVWLLAGRVFIALGWNK